MKVWLSPLELSVHIEKKKMKIFIKLITMLSRKRKRLVCKEFFECEDICLLYIYSDILIPKNRFIMMFFDAYDIAVYKCSKKMSDCIKTIKKERTIELQIV